MNPGRLIGRGRTAEVYSLGDGRVVKLLLPGFGADALELEASLTGEAHAAGVAAPGVHARVEIADRTGWVFDEIDGSVMLDALKRRPWRYRRFADELALVHAEMHRHHGGGLPDVKERIAAKIEAADPLDRRLRTAALDRLGSLADGDRVLHGDFHPGNVMLSATGPVTIDWLDAARGDPGADVARSLWLVSSATHPPEARFRQIAATVADRFGVRYLRSYLAASGADPREIARWRLPVVAARLAEGIAHEEARLLAETRRLAGR